MSALQLTTYALLVHNRAYYYLINFSDIKFWWFTMKDSWYISYSRTFKCNVPHISIQCTVHENQEFFPIQGNKWKLILKKYSRSNRLYRYIHVYLNILYLLHFCDCLIFYWRRLVFFSLFFFPSWFAGLGLQAVFGDVPHFPHPAIKSNK